MGTPHLDKLFTILRNTRLEKATWRTAWMPLETSALDSVVHEMESSSVESGFFSDFNLSVAFRGYVVEPEISAIWQWEAMLATELRDDIERGKYREALRKLDEVNRSDRDDVTLVLTRVLSDRALVTMAKVSDGKLLLAKMVDELSSGSYGKDESGQVDRLLRYSRSGVDIQKYADLQNTMVIPISDSPGGDSHVTARLGENGKVWVKVGYKAWDARYVRNLPDNITVTGLEFDPDDIVGLVFPEKSEALVFVTVAQLLVLANQVDTEVLQKIAKFSAAGAAIPFAGTMIGTNLVTGVSETAPQLARASWLAVEALDTAAVVVSTVGLFVDEVRPSLIRLGGERANMFLAYWDVLELALTVYGVGRVTVELAPVVAHADTLLTTLSAEMRTERAAKQAAKLTPDELAKLERDFAAAEKRFKQLKKVAAEPVGLVSGEVGGFRAAGTASQKATAIKPEILSNMAPATEFHPAVRGPTTGGGGVELRQTMQSSPQGGVSVGQESIFRPPADRTSTDLTLPKGQSAEALSKFQGTSVKATEPGLLPPKGQSAEALSKFQGTSVEAAERGLLPPKGQSAEALPRLPGTGVDPAELPMGTRLPLIFPPAVAITSWTLPPEEEKLPIGLPAQEGRRDEKISLPSIEHPKGAMHDPLPEKEEALLVTDHRVDPDSPQRQPREKVIAPRVSDPPLQEPDVATDAEGATKKRLAGPRDDRDLERTVSPKTADKEWSESSIIGKYDEKADILAVVEQLKDWEFIYTGDQFSDILNTPRWLGEAFPMRGSQVKGPEVVGISRSRSEIILVDIVRTPDYAHLEKGAIGYVDALIARLPDQFEGWTISYAEWYWALPKPLAEARWPVRKLVIIRTTKVEK